MGGDPPYAVDAFGVYRAYDELAAVPVRDVTDKLRAGYGGAVDGDLVGAAVQQARRVFER